MGHGLSCQRLVGPRGQAQLLEEVAEGRGDLWGLEKTP